MAQLLVGILLVWSAGITALLIASAIGKKSGHPLPELAEIAVGALSLQGGGLVMLHRLVRGADTNWGEAFGLNLRPRRAVLLGAGVVLLFLPGAYGLQMACAALLERLSVEPVSQKTVELLVTDGSFATRATIGLLAVGLAPIWEEALFRGVLFASLQRRGYRRLAYGLTAVLFGVIHGNAVAFVPLTLFGLVLAWLYERTDNLLAPMTAHALFNLAPFVMLALGIKPDQ